MKGNGANETALQGCGDGIVESLTDIELLSAVSRTDMSMLDRLGNASGNALTYRCAKTRLLGQLRTNSFDVDGHRALFGRLPISVHYVKQRIASQLI